MGSFTSGCFRFEIDRLDDESEVARSLQSDLEEWLDLRLIQSGKVPNLCGAPLASWLLARLAFLTDDCLCLAGEEANDGGGYEIDMVVYRSTVARPPQQPGIVQGFLFDIGELLLPVESEQPVAAFQLQADMEGVGVIGERAPDCSADELLGALAAALLAAPEDLIPCELVVRDPEWELDPEMYQPWPDADSRNVYGWDGTEFLGKDNITEAE